jgi:hypothetical protein
VERIVWEDLPDDLVRAIEQRTGPILTARTASAGQNSPLAATITTSEGKTFVKGLPSGERRTRSQAREIAVAPLVRDISPHLLWHFDQAGWVVLGYEHIEGRHADYRPGSGDLDALVSVLRALGEIDVPDPGPFKLAEDRFKTWVDDPDTLKVFSGATLMHTDWLPDNVLFTLSRPYLIDWAWPTLGAAWMDPAFWLIRLIASGHTIQDAERYAARVPGYANADPIHINLFASANVQMWDEIERQAPRVSPWMRSVVTASHEWHDFRNHEAGARR